MIAKVLGSGQEIAEYRISDREMPVGSTLGAPKATLIVKATGALERVYSSQAGMDVFGSLVLHHWERKSGIRLIAQPGEFVIRPHCQEHLFSLTNGLRVCERIFMLSGMPRGEDLRDVDPPAAYYWVEVRNESDEALDVATYASLRLHGGYTRPVSTLWDPQARAFVARDCEQKQTVRVASCSRVPDSFEVTQDAAKASAQHFPGKLGNATLERADDAIGIFHLDHALKPGEAAEYAFTLTFSLDGEEAARKVFASLPPAREALERTEAHYEAILQRAMVMTPDVEVNRGALWAKANMLRAELLAPQGWCFVNDPTRSNNSVARDTAWFGFGADLITPHFSKDALLWFVEHLRSDGMIFEYFDIRNGKTEDYGLNVNDDTPLILIALWHHYGATGDREFLEHVYPNAQRAARALLANCDDRGLVYCRADGTGSRGMVGWRNVIQGYVLSGATTEVNSECYSALRTVGYMAAELGDEENAAFFGARAEELRNAINEHLLDKERKLYYLAIGEDGETHSDITCDLVFPVLFGVADHDVATNIVATLSRPEFWTNAGLRTVPRDDLAYDPVQGSGLLGGVWGGPTFWFAAAAASYNPSFMVYALASAFKHYAEDPRRNNTVPGQFSEWLHGEALINQGMMLSPWFPPKYLWAAVEAAGGLDLVATPPLLAPHLPGEWQWISVRNVPVRGKPVSWFTVRHDELMTAASYPFSTVPAERRYDEDVSDDVWVSGDNAAHVALARKGEIAIMIGNTLDRTISTALRVKESRLPASCSARVFNSLIGEWQEHDRVDSARLVAGFPIEVARHGFSVIELRETSP